MQTTLIFFFFFFNDTATTEIYTLSLHDALPICKLPPACGRLSVAAAGALSHNLGRGKSMAGLPDRIGRVMHNRSGRLGLRFHRATVWSAGGDGPHHDMPAVDLPGRRGSPIGYKFNPWFLGCIPVRLKHLASLLGRAELVPATP